MLARLLVVVVASFVLAGSVVHAAPGKRASHPSKNKKKKAKRVIEDREDLEDRAAPRRGEDEPRVAMKSHDVDLDPVTVTDEADDLAPQTIANITPPRHADWHVAIGPYGWYSAFDAKVSLGGKTVDAGAAAGAGGDLLPIERHIKYGGELLGEVRHGPWVMTGDVMFGAVSLTGSANLGPLMASLSGDVSMVLGDGSIGYTVLGDEHSIASLDLRAGLRYQRTSFSAGVGVEGSSAQLLDSTTAGSDALVGARGMLRPWPWMSVSGAVDHGLFGGFRATWSASIDAGALVTPHVQLSIGYRTLNVDNSQLDLTLHGPRVAVQLVF